MGVWYPHIPGSSVFSDLCNQSKLETPSIGVQVQNIQIFSIADRQPI